MNFPCNHPRTPENTKANNNRPGGRCRTCQRAHERAAQAKRRALVKINAVTGLTVP